MTFRVDAVTATGLGFLEAVQRTIAHSEDTILCVAFAHERGVRMIGKELEDARLRGSRTRLLVTTAFDRGGTTRDALVAAAGYGVEVRVHNHAGGTFHPKLNLGLAGNQAKAVIGSANLTGGLVSNVEVGVELAGARSMPALTRAWEVGEQLWNDPRSERWEAHQTTAPAERIEPRLHAALSRALSADPVFMTRGPHPKQNRLVKLTGYDMWLETEKSRRERKGPQPLPAWMLNLAWEYLEAHGELSNTFLLKKLRVHRSSAVCAVLARLREVEVVPGPRIVLRMKRGPGVTR